MLLRSSYYLSLQSGGVAGGCWLLGNNYLFINNYQPESAFDRVNTGSLHLSWFYSSYLKSIKPPVPSAHWSGMQDAVTGKVRIIVHKILINNKLSIIDWLERCGLIKTPLF